MKPRARQLGSHLAQSQLRFAGLACMAMAALLLGAVYVSSGGVERTVAQLEQIGGTSQTAAVAYWQGALGRPGKAFPSPIACHMNYQSSGYGPGCTYAYNGMTSAVLSAVAPDGRGAVSKGRFGCNLWDPFGGCAGAGFSFQGEDNGELVVPPATSVQIDWACQPKQQISAYLAGGNGWRYPYVAMHTNSWVTYRDVANTTYTLAPVTSGVDITESTTAAWGVISANANPANITGSGTVTSESVAGAYDFDLFCTGANQATLALKVYKIDMTPAASTRQAGQSTTLNTSTYAFTSCSVAGPGLAATAVPTSMTSVRTSSIPVTPPATPGAYTYTLTCNYPGGGVATKQTTITVTPVPMVYSVSDGGDKTVVAGSSVTNTITISRGSGGTNPVTFGMDAGFPLPSGVNASFAPTECTPTTGTCTSILTLSTSPTTPPSLLYFMSVVTNSVGTMQRYSNFFLTVRAPPFNFQISIGALTQAPQPASNAASVILAQAGGVTMQRQITATLTAGNASPVVFSFATQGSPAGGPTASFSPPSCTPAPTCTSVMTVTPGTTAAGSYSAIITGQGGGTTVEFPWAFNNSPACPAGSSGTYPNCNCGVGFLYNASTNVCTSLAAPTASLISSAGSTMNVGDTSTLTATFGLGAGDVGTQNGIVDQALAYVEGGSGWVASHTYEFVPTVPGVYTFHARGSTTGSPTATNYATTIITVSDVVPTCTLMASPTSVVSGSAPLLSYTFSGVPTAGAILCSIPGRPTGMACTNPGAVTLVSPGTKSGGVVTNASGVIKPITYTMTVSNTAGSATCSANINAQPALTCPTISIEQGFPIPSTVYGGTSGSDNVKIYTSGGVLTPQQTTPVGSSLRPQVMSIANSLSQGSYQLRLYTAANAQIGNSCSFTMAAPNTISVGAIGEASEPAVPATFTVSRTGSLLSALTMSYALSGTATPGTDYDVSVVSGGTYSGVESGQLSFSAGSGALLLRITPNDDNEWEGAETIVINVTAPAGYTNPGGSPGGVAPASMGLLDDEASCLNGTGAAGHCSACDQGYQLDAGWCVPLPDLCADIISIQSTVPLNCQAPNAAGECIPALRTWDPISFSCVPLDVCLDIPNIPDVQTLATIPPGCVAPTPGPTGMCIPLGSVWDSSALRCIPSPPVLDLVIGPDRVRKGGTVRVSWQASGLGVSSCTLRQSGVAGTLAVGLSNLGVYPSGKPVVINERTTFTLSCNGGTPVSRTVPVLPTFLEL